MQSKVCHDVARRECRAASGRLDKLRWYGDENPLEPSGSTPLVEGYLGRMRWPDQAAYLRKISTLGLDSQRLKKALAEPPEQAIGFIEFSRLRIF